MLILISSKKKKRIGYFQDGEVECCQLWSWFPATISRHILNNQPAGEYCEYCYLTKYWLQYFSPLCHIFLLFSEGIWFGLEWVWITQQKIYGHVHQYFKGRETEIWKLTRNRNTKVKSCLDWRKSFKLNLTGWN